MKIKYFAWIKELTKNNEEYLDSNEIQNIKELRKFIMIDLYLYLMVKELIGQQPKL